VIRVTLDRACDTNIVGQIIPEQIGGSGIRSTQARNQDVRSRGARVKSVSEIARGGEYDAYRAGDLRGLALAARAGRAQATAAAIQQSDLAGDVWIWTGVVYSTRRHINDRRRKGRDRRWRSVNSAPTVFFPRELTHAQASQGRVCGSADRKHCGRRAFRDGHTEVVVAVDAHLIEGGSGEFDVSLNSFGDALERRAAAPACNTRQRL